MKKTILILLVTITAYSVTPEYKNFLNDHKTSSRFYCKNKILVNEYIKPNDTNISYREIVINNKTVTCNLNNDYIDLPDLGISVKYKE